MSSNNKKKSSGQVLESHKKCRKYDPTTSSSSSSPIQTLVVSPTGATPERKKLKLNDCVIEPTLVPSTTIRACTSDEDIEVLVFDSSTSSSQSNDNIEASSTDSSKNDLISTSNRRSGINASIEEFQRTLSYLKNKIGLPGAESTPNEDVTGKKTVNIHETTSLETTTTRTSCSSVINDSYISDNSESSPLIQSLSTKRSSILKQSSSSKQSSSLKETLELKHSSQSKQSSPVPSKVQKMEITTQKVKPRTVELTTSMPVNVNCKALVPNDNKSPIAVQTETQMKYESKKKLHQVKVSEDSSGSFKSLRMDSGLENYEPHKFEAKTKKIIPCPAYSKEEKNDSLSELASESKDSSTTEHFDKYLKKLHDIFKTKKIKSTAKKKYMKSLLEEICKVELSDETGTASDPSPSVSLDSEMKDWSKNISPTESKCEKYLKVLEQKLMRKKGINKVKSKLSPTSVQLYAKEKTLSSEATEILHSRKEGETSKICETNSKETYVLASLGSSKKESDCSIKFAENERNYQLSWIENEIKHLHKLKDKLEIKNKKPSKRRSNTNVYNISKADGSSEKTYVIKTNVDVSADENINNYIFDGEEYVVSHSQKFSSDSDQAIAGEIVQYDVMDMLCKKCMHIICNCPSKTTLQSKLSSLGTESNLCLHCQQFICICQEKIDEHTGSPAICACFSNLECICQNKEAIAENSSTRIPSNEYIHVKVKQPVASKKESSDNIPFLDFHSLNEEYYCLCGEPSTTEISSSKERLVLAVAKCRQKSTQTEKNDKPSFSKDSHEAQSLIEKAVNTFLAKWADKKNTQEKSAVKSSSTQAIKICDAALQTSKYQIETDESLSTRAVRDSLSQLEENGSNAPSKMSEELKAGALKEYSREKLTENVSSLLEKTWPLTDQYLNSLAQISEFGNDEAETGLLSSKDNPYSEKFRFGNDLPKQHKNTQTEIRIVTGLTQTHKNDDNNTGGCVSCKCYCRGCCASKKLSTLTEINKDLKNDLAKMLEELKKVDNDASIKQSSATSEISPDRSSAVEEIVPKPTYQDIGVQVHPNLFTATAQTSVEKLMKDGHANTDANKYGESIVQTSPGFQLSAQPLDKFKKDKNENTDLQVLEPIKDPNTYRDIGVQVSPSFYVPTVQLKKDKNENTYLKGTMPLIDPNTYRNIGVQASPSFHTAAAQTLDNVKKNKSENTDPKETGPLKDPNTYRDIAVQVSPSLHSSTDKNLDKLKKDKNENTNNFKDTFSLTDPNTYRNIGVQVSPISHSASAQTVNEVKENKDESTHFNDVPLKDPNTYRDFGVQVSPSFHAPIIDQPSVQKLNMDEFESTDAEHKHSSIVTCSKCKKCELKKKHHQSKKATSDSTNTITTSLSDSTASSTSRITCSCCKQKAFLAEVNYMQNGKNLWAICSRCFYNRMPYCGYTNCSSTSRITCSCCNQKVFLAEVNYMQNGNNLWAVCSQCFNNLLPYCDYNNCRSVCQCWKNTSRMHYSRCCKMDISTSKKKVQGVAYTVTLLNNDASKLQELSTSNLEDVIKIQKGWTPNHLKYLKNQENNDRRLREDIENKDTKEKAKNKKISATEITDGNKHIHNEQGKPKNTSKTDIKDKNNNHGKNKEKISQNKTSRADTENENTKNEDENNKNENQDESSEIQSVQFTLMDYLSQNRPEFVSTAEYRREMLLKSKKSREQQREAKKLNFLKNYFKEPNKGKFKLFSEQEMRNINKKNYYKLPEVRGRILNQREDELRHADRLMSSLLAKKIQKSVLNGKGRFPIDQSLTNL